MIKILLPTQSYPKWLVNVIPKHSGARMGGTITTDMNIVIVFAFSGAYHAIALLPGVYCCISGFNNVIVQFQSPKGGSGGVIFRHLIDRYTFIRCLPAVLLLLATMIIPVSI